MASNRLPDAWFSPLAMPRSPPKTRPRRPPLSNSPVERLEGDTAQRPSSSTHTGLSFLQHQPYPRGGKADGGWGGESNVHWVDRGAQEVKQ